MYNENIHPIVLTILDGWGHSEKTKGNAIQLANTPNINKISQKYPKSLLNASGENVGLPENQMGNSEVGHTTIGGGRIINQELVRIQKSIDTGEFFNNETITKLYKEISKRKSKLHIIGLCSDGGVHSHIKHLQAIITTIKNYKEKFETCLHLITDGRDTSAKVVIKFLDTVSNDIKNESNINICTLSGRYYSMDRDCRWSRTEKMYKVLTEENEVANEDTYKNIIEQFYKQDISDEFIPPTRIYKGIISNNDGILFFNFRPDRTRQLLECLAKPNFKGFLTKKIYNLLFTTFTEYDPSLKCPVVFSAINHENFLGQIVSNNNFRQLRLAETEKYAHVTYFFNGGIEEPFPGEDRELIPSPKVNTYDLKPEMSAYEITDSIIRAIDKNIYKLIIVNYANTDMVGHTGDIKATIKATEVVDLCIGKIYNKIKSVKGTMIITADHGNADCMIDNIGQPCKSHTTNPVPFIVIQDTCKPLNILRKEGNLSDIAPTILEILKIKIPEEMNGKSLIKQQGKEVINKVN